MIPMVLERRELEEFECLACHAYFADEHCHPIAGWSWCPKCGTKWEGVMLYRLTKWQRFYKERGMEMTQTPMRGWFLEKRWFDFDGNPGEWEETHIGCYGAQDRNYILDYYRSKMEEQECDREYGNCYWEYRIVRKTFYVWWGKFWQRKVLEGDKYRHGG